jgi:hypothetical protein
LTFKLCLCFLDTGVKFRLGRTRRRNSFPKRLCPSLVKFREFLVVIRTK